MRLIGSGAVASVYLCENDAGDRAAVKWLNHAHGHLLGRFRREIESLRKLNHPGVTRFVDAGDVDGRPYLAMEHISGTDLRRYTTKLHQRPSAERYARCRAIGRALSDALEYIHKYGLVHRDVKPSNVFISDEDRVVLGDFGVVKDPDAMEKTAMGVVVGTLAYAAPEQIQAEGVDARTDVFGLGATLYYLLTQQRPFEGLDRDFSALPMPPSRIDPGIPVDLEGAVMRMLASDPNHRPRDAASVRALMSSEAPGGTVLAGTRPTVHLVAECLDRAGEGETLFVRPTGPAGTRKAWVGDLLRQGAQRRGIPVIEVLEWGAWEVVRGRLNAGEALLGISPHELDVPDHASRVEIQLKPLGLADVRRSLVSMAPQEPDPALTAVKLHEWTGGLPRLLAAVFEDCVEDGRLNLPSMSAPNAHVDHFFDGLDMDAMEVLGAIALSSGPVDVGTIEAVTQVPADEVVQDLVAKGLIVDLEGRFRLMGTMFRPATERLMVDPEGMRERIESVALEMGRHSTVDGTPQWIIDEIRKGIIKAEESLVGGGLAQGLAAVRRAADLSSAVADRSIKAEATIALANVLIRVGLLDEAARRLSDATALAHAEGRDDLRRFCHGLRAWVSLDQQPRSRASAASAVDRILPMLVGAEARGVLPEDALLYAVWSRACAVLGDKATHVRTKATALEMAKHLDAPLSLGIRLQIARGVMVFGDRDEARELVRPVISGRENYPLLGWEAARMMAIIDGGVPPSPGALSEGLSPTVVHALESRPI
ncbi:MAG: protein kinase [Deltaproteobacteria bacterium]|nr:protein kinase [Deltaproteobacteria bacterium]